MNQSQVLQNSSFDANSSILTTSIDAFQSMQQPSIQHTGDLEDSGGNQGRGKIIAASASRQIIKHAGK